MRKSESFSRHIYETSLSTLSSIPVESGILVINWESIKRCFDYRSAPFSQSSIRVDVDRSRCVSTAPRHLSTLIDIKRGREELRIRADSRGEQTRASLFRALDIFLYTTGRRARLLRVGERSRDFSLATFLGFGTRKTRVGKGTTYRVRVDVE